MMNAAIEVTTFTKSDGPLTKRIALGTNGDAFSDASACLMTSGSAQRTKVTNVKQLVELIESIGSDQALALGALRADLPDRVEIVTRAKLNGAASPNTIARIADSISYRPGRAAFALLDSDTKGLPPDIAAEIDRRGGFWPTLLSLFSALHGVACVTRSSTSAGLSRSDTGETLPGSGGLHCFPAVQDGADVERFLKVLHDRCWLAGFGWMMVGAGGQLLVRSLIDRSVFGAERLVFEGPPILESPLQQDRESRRPVATEGDVLDTIAAFPPLTIVEKAKLDQLKAKRKYELATEAEKVRNVFIEARAQLFINHGMSRRGAERAAASYCNGILLPAVVLPFDDPEFAGCTVADVLAGPARFEGATLADPLEGIDYGTCKAKIFRRPDGVPWIHSFAHGRSIYELKFDAGAVRAAIDQITDDKDVAKAFVKLAAVADLDSDELEELYTEAIRRSGTKKMAIKSMLKKEQQKRADRHAEQERERRTAQRTDPRPRINTPDIDAPWSPVMNVLNSVLGASPDAKPPSRNIDGNVARARKIIIPQTHTTNPNPDYDDKPPAEQWALSRLDEMELAEMIEAHIDFVDDKGRSVHLPSPFVKHYLRRDDQALPTVVAIAAAPIVLADGEILAPEGLDRLRGIIFEIPKEVRAILPRREDCNDEAVKEAMCFLCEEWLCDVSTDFTGKATIIAAALTIIERSLLPNRPTFFVSAGRRGGGKGTTIEMLIMAAVGVRAAMSAWSTNEEERRKTLLALFLSGVGYIAWDNIERGSQISCPHIERASTATFYADRKLGVSEMINAAASAIHFFSGNNIRPRGDLASRSLIIQLAIDRPDPENRAFKHPDPIDWTETNRAVILKAFYTILLGNPQLQLPHDAPAQTRFKLWWWLVGSAVEHAAGLRAGEHAVNFKELFVRQEETQDEDSVSLADVLDEMLKQWPVEFTATDVAGLINGREGQSLSLTGLALRDFFYPDAPAGFTVSTKSVGKRLAIQVDNVVRSGERILTLRSTDRSGVKGSLGYFVEERLEKAEEAEVSW